MFRDYGFIEPFPQRFYYTHDDQFMVQFDVVQDDDRKGSFPPPLKIVWDKRRGIPKEKYALRLFTGYLRRQIRRLKRLRNIVYRDGNPGMPEHEWDTAWEFQKVNLRAMTMALEAVGEPVDTPSKTLPTTTASTTAMAIIPHYDPLGPETDDLTYSEETCDNEDDLQHVDHLDVDFTETRYQDLNFMIEPTTRDVVMELDSVTQISSVYRPQYHEYSVHASARFLDSVRRVIFIGGGDSMLLHEILKYPELEFVVGLELDQTVTRKAFRYFSTRPHFDDPRVEWWFGDATKSLLLLPKDYWQSFDLVLVDLSETVMSFGVTSQLDVFEALALLLKPEGILVKNEIYMETLSTAFDHTIQICYVSPVICDQVFVMGSNKVDFFHAPVKDHGIPTLLYEPMTTSQNRHDYLHDYRQNDARNQGKCKNMTQSMNDNDDEVRTNKRAGIVEIIEAEHVSIVLDKTAVSILEKVVTTEGFQLNQKSLYDKNLTLISMKEGYILVRFFSDDNYCSMDIHLWGRFDKLKSLSMGLTQALGSTRVSNYRVVVGGMFGSSAWEYDKTSIGPQIVQTRDCSIAPPPNKEKDEKDPSLLLNETAIMTAVLKDSISSFAIDESFTTLVVCGPSDTTCLTHDILTESKLTSGEITRLSTCPNLDPVNYLTWYDCEIAIRAEWKALSSNSNQFGILAIDPTTPKEFLQIINSVLCDNSFRQSVVSEHHHVVLGWSTKPEEEGWRHEFLDRYRKQHMNDPVSRALFDIRYGSHTIELGIVAAGYKDVAVRLDQAEKNIQQGLSSSTGSVTLKILHGGKYAEWDPWEPKRFLQSDYDDTAALEQYYGQKSLAVHSVIQFERIKGSKLIVTSKMLQEIFNQAVEAMEVVCTSKQQMNDIGEGYMTACLSPEFGTIVLVWDGRHHFDISYYTIEQGPHISSDMDLFIARIREEFDEEIELTIRDDMPRGREGVINFRSDMESPQQRERMYQNLLLRAEKKRKLKKNNTTPPTKKPNRPIESDTTSQMKEEGSCNNVDADANVCWPDLPPLNA